MTEPKPSKHVWSVTLRHSIPRLVKDVMDRRTGDTPKAVTVRDQGVSKTIVNVMR